MDTQIRLKFELEPDKTESVCEYDTIQPTSEQSISDNGDKWRPKDNDSMCQISETRQDPANTGDINFDEDMMLIQQIKRMSTEELTERVFECIRLCVENKINIRNAFNLHLMDWLLHLLKDKNNSIGNFSVLAYTLDASTKIYSHRVDIVYKEVMRFGKLLTPFFKNERCILQNGEERNPGKKAHKPINRQKMKKTIIMNSVALERKPAKKTPLHKFVMVGDQPGDLMEAMLKTGKSFYCDAPFRPCLLYTSRCV